MAFFLQLEEAQKNGETRDLYPELFAGYAAGRLQKPNMENPPCPNIVRYEVMSQFGYFVTESSEHFSEYVPWFTKSGQPELLDRFAIPLDEYRTRCEDQIADWAKQLREFRTADRIEVGHSREYASDVVNFVWTGTPLPICGNVPNEGLRPSSPTGQEFTPRTSAAFHLSCQP